MKYNLFYAGYNRVNDIEQIGYFASSNLSDWVEHSSDPLISIDQVKGHTDRQTSNPCVLCVDGVYKMWYQAKSDDGVFAVMYAQSTDMVSWVFNNQPVLSLGAGNGFRFGVQHPHVIYDESIYKMWCTVTEDNGSFFSYYESKDGIVWELVKRSVITPDYYWEGRFVLYPMVVKEGNLYKMWYTGKSSDSSYTIGYAQSLDGIVWDKKAYPVIAPFIIPRIARRLVEFICKIFNVEIKIPLYGIGSPFVWKEDSKYFLIGHAVGTHGRLYISRYTSVDGIYWHKVTSDILQNITAHTWNKFFQGDPYLYVEQ